MFYRYLLVLILVSAAFAMDPDAGSSVEYAVQHTEQSNATITITPVDDYIISGLTSPRGLDYSDTFDQLYIADYGLDQILNVNPATGALNYYIACPAEIPSVAGVVCDRDNGVDLLINDWGSVHDIYAYTGSWAYAFANPVPLEPRGMDIDYEGYIWGQDASDRQLYMSNYGGSSVVSWAMPECPASFSCGIAVFPFGPNLGIVLGGYAWTNFYFYEYDGSNLTFLGSAPVPYTASSSYGLTYSDNSNSFYWLYRDASTAYHIAEFTAIIETALQRETWGSIKTNF